MPENTPDRGETLDCDYWDEEEGGVGATVRAAPDVYIWAPDERALLTGLAQLVEQLLAGAQSPERMGLLETLWATTEEGEAMCRFAGLPLVLLMPDERSLRPLLEVLLAHGWLTSGQTEPVPRMRTMLAEQRTND